MRLKSAIIGDDWRPIILKGEANRGTLDKVDLHFDSVSGVDEVPSDEYKGGFTVLTSVRLIWATNPRSASFGVPCVLPLFSVVDTELKIEGKLTSLLKPSKIKLTIRLDEQGYPTDSRRAVSCERVKLVCRGGTPEAWYSLLQRTLAERAWVVGGSSATPSERSFHSRSSSLQGSPQRSQRSFNRAGSWSGSPERGPPRLALSPTPALSPLLLQQYGPRPSGYASPERSQRSLTGRPPHGGPSPPRRQPSSDSLASGLHPGSVGVGLPNPPSRTLSMTPQQAPPVDPTLVDQLERMGFPNRQAVSALLATGSAGLQPALDWLLDSANTAVLDQPAPYPPCPAPPDQQPSPAGPTNWGAALMAGVLGRGRNRGIVDAAPPQPLPAQQQASQWECGPMGAAMVGTSFSTVAGVDTSGGLMQKGAQSCDMAPAIGRKGGEEGLHGMCSSMSGAMAPPLSPAVPS